MNDDYLAEIDRRARRSKQIVGELRAGCKLSTYGMLDLIALCEDAISLVAEVKRLRAEIDREPEVQG